MAIGEERSETLNLGKRRSFEAEDEEEEEREIEELKQEVDEMAEKIFQCRREIPGRVLAAFSARLEAQRPLLPPHIAAAVSSPSRQSALAGIGTDPAIEVQVPSKISEGAVLEEANQRIQEKLEIFKRKTASNIAAMPNIMKRMEDCITRIDKLEQCNVNIHSVFKRKCKY